MMNGKPLHGSIGTGSTTCFPGRYSPPYRNPDPVRRCMPNHSDQMKFRPTCGDGFVTSSFGPLQGNLFGGLDDGGLLSRAEALAAVDISKHTAPTNQGLQLKHDMMYHHPPMGSTHPSSNMGGHRPHHQMSHHGHMDSAMDHLLDPIGSAGLAQMTADMSSGGVSVSVSHSHSNHQLHHNSSVYTSHPMNSMMHHSSHHMSALGPHAASVAAAMHHSGGGGGGGGGGVGSMNGGGGISVGNMGGGLGGGCGGEAEADPRELESFAERFKQRRIKLGVTQADVGRALANLKLPGVGALSQSTICRFESLTLSHNNMIALKPILQAWLEEAEAQARNKRKDPDAPDVLPNGEKKRKRTSIAAPEKRSLEAYFAVQPRPSGEKIAAIAEKLDLKKNVVRVWFCNQRQKQKRMKFSAVQH